MGYSRQRASRLPGIQRVRQGSRITPLPRCAALHRRCLKQLFELARPLCTQAMRAIARAQDEEELTLESVNYQGAPVQFSLSVPVR